MEMGVGGTLKCTINFDKWSVNIRNNMLCKVVLIVILCCAIGIGAQPPSKRFEYKYSFKPPYLAQRDGSIPFWEYGGNAIASSENVRLAPSLKSQKGGVWSKQPLNFQWWEVDIMFRVTGRGRIGADGLAFWYTQNKGAYDGNVFGSSDKWVGLGMMMDSFDNDNKHNNPYIMGVVNDGTKTFDHQNDGSTQMLAGCLRDFRNKPFPTRIKIEYYQNILTVYYHNGMTNNEADYELCFRSDGVVLPSNGYFGVTAATGGLADDHDVIHFLTSSLHPPGTQTHQQINQDEQQKLSNEYQEYQKKLEQQKEDYRREHPDEHKEKDEFEDWFESDSQRELRQIFHGQSSIFEVVKDLHKKIDEIIGKQVNSLSMLSSIYQMQQGQVGVPQPGGAQPGHVPQIAPMPIQRHEVESILATQNVFLATLGELKNYIIDLSRKSDSIIQTQARAPTAQVQSVGYESSQAAMNELRDSLNSVKQNIAAIGQRMGSTQAQQATCPQPNCLTAGVLAVFLASHLLVMFLYSLYNARKESQAKKFY